jgi:hypothetical protein
VCWYFLFCAHDFSRECMRLFYFYVLAPFWYFGCRRKHNSKFSVGMVGYDKQYWTRLSMTAASCQEGFKRMDNTDVLDEFKTWMAAEEGAQFQAATATLNRNQGAVAPDPDKIWEAMEAFCNTATSRETDLMFQKLATLSAKVYVMAMSMLQAKAVVYNRKKWADELQGQVRLLPNEAKAFLNDPNCDEAMMEMLYASYQAQVMDPASHSHVGGYLDEGGAGYEETSNYGGKGSSATAKPQRSIFGAGAQAKSGKGKRAAESVPSDKDFNSFFEGPAKKKPVITISEEGPKEQPKEEPWSPAAAYETAVLLDAMDPENEAWEADKEYMAEIMNTVPVADREKYGLPKIIKPESFSEDCKVEFALLLAAVHQAQDFFLKKYVLDLRNGKLHEMHVSNMNEGGLLKMLNANGYFDTDTSGLDVKNILTKIGDAKEADEASKELITLQEKVLRHLTTEKEAAALFDATVDFMSKFATQAPAVSALRDFLHTMGDSERKAMNMRDHAAWSEAKIRLKGWKEEVAKRATFSVLTYKAFTDKS